MLCGICTIFAFFYSKFRIRIETDNCQFISQSLFPQLRETEFRDDSVRNYILRMCASWYSMVFKTCIRLVAFLVLHNTESTGNFKS